MNEEIDGYIKLVKKTISEKRALHSRNVADMCFKLASAHGEDPIKAYTAGILHDIRKEAPPNVIKNETAVSGLSPDPIELVTPQLWHAVAGAYFVKTNLHIKDKDIINAIRFHTIGRAEMSKLEKIVYLSDLTSKDRSYPDVEKYRKYAFDDLDNAMFHAVRWSIKNTMAKNGRLPRYTFEAYNYFVKAEFY